MRYVPVMLLMTVGGMTLVRVTMVGVAMLGVAWLVVPGMMFHWQYPCRLFRTNVNSRERSAKWIRLRHRLELL